MSVNNDYPVYDGIAPSWADFKCVITGTTITLLETKDVAAVNTSRSVEVGEKRGASGGRVMSRTTGASSQEASFTLYYDGYLRMLETLMAQAIARNFVRGNEVLISLVHFDFQMLHTPPGSTRIFDRRVKGARVIGDSLNPAEGTEATKVEVPLSVIKIADMINGKELVLL